MKSKGDGGQKTLIGGFNIVVDMTSTFVKGVFPQAVKFIVGVKGVFSKKEKAPEDKN